MKPKFNIHDTVEFLWNGTMKEGMITGYNTLMGSDRTIIIKYDICFEEYPFYRLEAQDIGGFVNRIIEHITLYEEHVFYPTDLRSIIQNINLKKLS